MAPDSYSMRTFLERFPHLFLVDAFTKIYAIPGLRLGYGLSADADLMEKNPGCHTAMERFHTGTGGRHCGTFGRYLRT